MASLYAQISNQLATGVVLAYFAARFMFAAEFGFAPAPVPAITGAPSPLPARVSWPVAVGRAAVVVTVVGWALHLGSLVSRGFAAGRVPWGSTYELCTSARRRSRPPW